MGLHEYAAAQEALARWRQALIDDRVAKGLALASEVQYEVSDAAGAAVSAVRALILSIPDPRYDEDAVIDEVRELNARTRVMYPDGPMEELVDAVDRNVEQWPALRRRRDAALARADEWALVASISRRDDAAVSAETHAEVVSAYLDLTGRTQSRAAHMQLAREGAEAFGVQFLVDVVLAAYGKGLGEDASLWAADAALDELAALAASTNPDHLAPAGARAPIPAAVAARQALIGLAEYPEL